MTRKFLLGFGFIAAAAFSGCQDQAALQSFDAYNPRVGDQGIIGGVEIDSTHYLARYTVAIYDSVEGSLCTGSIISDTHVLTAAHCVDGKSPSDFLIIYGSNLVDKDVLDQSPTGSVTAAAVHELWGTKDDSTELDVGDIAVLKLAESIPKGFTPVEILSQDKALTDGQDVVLAGFGIAVPETSDGAGLLRIATTTVDTAQIGENKTEVLVDQLLGQGACGGDSGGPGFVVEGEGEAVYLWGLTSRGSLMCDTKSIYTSVVAYAEWIEAAKAELDGGGEHLVAEAQ